MKFPKIKTVIKGHTKIEIINMEYQIVRENQFKCINSFKRERRKIN